MIDLAPLLELLNSKLSSGQRFSEYELLGWLQQPEQAIFDAEALKQTTTLFQSHFLLMHALYMLRQMWLENHHAWLEISALSIVKKPWQHSASQALAETDKLAEYYLDLKQLATPEEDLEQLLNDFWRRMLKPELKDADLTVLELQEPVDLKQITRQYRRLAMHHHPDRGGNPEKFQQIQASYQRLRQGYLP